METNTTKYSSKSLSISRAWCADFVNWVWYNSGAGNNAHLRNGNGREIANWTNYKFGGHGKHRIFDSRRRPTKFEPKPGDAIIFGASLAANEHIGIVVHVYGWNDMDLVEGNAGSTDTQVYLHSHYHPGSCASCGAVYSKPFAYLSPVGDE